MTLALASVPLVMGTVAGTVFAAVATPHNGAGSQAAAAPDLNCTLIVPADPLSAQGLATPYQLMATNPAMGPCHEANANQSAFVEAAVLAPGGQLTLYDPLVVDAGTQPAVPPVPAQVPAGSTVGIWFGFNGGNLVLRPAGGANSLSQGNCVNGGNNSVFGQFAYCNAPAFYQAANTQIAAKTLQVPPLGTAKDGMPCPTTRDFSVVDQDQSDNVVTHYLADGQGRIAQSNAAGRSAAPNATDLANGSDNLLLSQFMDPALGCTAWMRPDQSSDGRPSAALPLDELSAAADQQAPVALVPLNDPMTLQAGSASPAKTTLYRSGVDQAALGAADNGNGAAYCRNIFGNAAGIQRVFKDQALFAQAPSLDANMATNLFTFLAMRANQTFTNLGCGKLLNAPDPIMLTTGGNGVVTAATMVPIGQSPSPSPSASASAPAAPSASATPSAAASATPRASATPSTAASATPPASTTPSTAASATPGTTASATPAASATPTRTATGSGPTPGATAVSPAAIPSARPTAPSSPTATASNRPSATSATAGGTMTASAHAAAPTATSPGATPATTSTPLSTGVVEHASTAMARTVGQVGLVPRGAPDTGAPPDTTYTAVKGALTGAAAGALLAAGLLLIRGRRRTRYRG